MRRIRWSVVSLIVAALCCSAAPPAAAQGAAGGEADLKLAAESYFEKITDQYMHSDLAEFEASLKLYSRHARHLTGPQRADVTYMRGACKEYRPAWWKYTKYSKNITFTATIWDRSFKANYMPSEMMGFQMPVGIDERTGRFQVVVSWQPHKVDSPEEYEGRYEKAHRLTEGDVAEAIVWHELGHNYITQGLHASLIIKLYSDHRLLFQALQEFYADMTAMYHCSPQGRKATMMIRTPELSWNDVNDPHMRAAHAIGAYLLANVLADVSAWPSFRLPTKVPTEGVERNTILYMYQHIDPRYTLAEDRALREMVGKFLRTQGASILRKHGTVRLPSGQEFILTTAQDRANQAQRDAWVKAELEKAIASGLVKKADDLKGHPKRFRIKVPW